MSPTWNMSYLYAYNHYTDSSGKSWYSKAAFYKPQFNTDMADADGKGPFIKPARIAGNLGISGETMSILTVIQLRRKFGFCQGGGVFDAYVSPPGA